MFINGGLAIPFLFTILSVFHQGNSLNSFPHTYTFAIATLLGSKIGCEVKMKIGLTKDQ